MTSVIAWCPARLGRVAVTDVTTVVMYVSDPSICGASCGRDDEYRYATYDSYPFP
jgi:hypothetical protein